MKRSLRRHHVDRIKQRMVAYIHTWGSRSRKLTEDPEFVGKMASCHGTHDCIMCHVEKLYEKPETRKRVSYEEKALA